MKTAEQFRRQRESDEGFLPGECIRVINVEGIELPVNCTLLKERKSDGKMICTSFEWARFQGVVPFCLDNDTLIQLAGQILLELATRGITPFEVSSKLKDIVDLKGGTSESSTS